VCEFSVRLSQPQVERLLVNIHRRSVDVSLPSLGLCDSFPSICRRKPERHWLQPDCALPQSDLAVVIWILGLELLSRN
jgi:hypothetical protein